MMQQDQKVKNLLIVLVTKLGLLHMQVDRRHVGGIISTSRHNGGGDEHLQDGRNCRGRVSSKVRPIIFARMVTRSWFGQIKTDRFMERGDIDRDTGGGKGKNRLVEHDVMRDVYAPGGSI